jgi:hypothetical protein
MAVGCYWTTARLWRKFGMGGYCGGTALLGEPQLPFSARPSWLVKEASAKRCSKAVEDLHPRLSRSILPSLADLPVSRVAELTPGAWAARS